MCGLGPSGSRPFFFSVLAHRKRLLLETWATKEQMMLMTRARIIVADDLKLMLEAVSALLRESYV